MKSFRADYVFPVCADPIKNGIVTVDDAGMVIAVADQNTPPPGAVADVPVEQLSGIICPGFVNTHCHLELSHLRGKIARHTSLAGFIKDVQQEMASDERQVLDAAYAADHEMYENGIVAVGDISNTNSSIPVKEASKLYYHTFVETFSFQPSGAETAFNKALGLLQEFKPRPASITPHAPYSVSKELFKLIRNYCENNENLISMHNQECEDENRFYRYKQGSFVDLYAHLGIDIGHFKPMARNSLQSVLPMLTNRQRILLVHNTCTNLKDIYFIKRFDQKIYWCFCPNANLYIENKLPKVDLFVGQGYDITLGTDSLASNGKLCILNEMHTLQQNFPELSLIKLVEWATLNGAIFLGIDDEKGTIEAGKTPGLNLLTGLDGFRITPETRVRRLV